MLKEYDAVRLIRLTEAVPVELGTKGTVLIVHAASPPAYEVEFMDSKGGYLGPYTVSGSDLEKLRSDD